MPLFLEKKHLIFSSKSEFKKLNMSTLEGKCEVLMDFPADFITQTMRQMLDALNAFGRHLDQVSTI